MLGNWLFRLMPKFQRHIAIKIILDIECSLNYKQEIEIFLEIVKNEPHE